MNLIRSLFFTLLLVSSAYSLSDYTKGFMLYKKGSTLLDKNVPKANKMFSKALPFLEKAASENSSQAYFMLGRMYCNGWGVDVDFEKAKEYFIKSIDLGDKRSNCCIARLLIIKLHNVEAGLPHLKQAEKDGIPACKDIKAYLRKLK